MAANIAPPSVSAVRTPRGRAAAGGPGEDFLQRQAVLVLGDATGCGWAAAFHADETASGPSPAAKRRSPISKGTTESFVPCVMMSGWRIAHLRDGVEFLRQDEPDGQHPPCVCWTMSRMFVNVASSTTPEASGRRSASSAAMAPPSECPTM